MRGSKELIITLRGLIYWAHFKMSLKRMKTKHLNKGELMKTMKTVNKNVERENVDIVK